MARPDPANHHRTALDEMAGSGDRPGAHCNHDGIRPGAKRHRRFVVMGRLDRSIVLPKLALTGVLPPMVRSSRTMTKGCGVPRPSGFGRLLSQLRVIEHRIAGAMQRAGQAAGQIAFLGVAKRPADLFAHPMTVQHQPGHPAIALL